MNGYTKKTKNKGFMLTIIGLVAMTLMILTKIVPTTLIAGYSVILGFVFFFVVEAVEKKQGVESGLRFKTFLKDMKKPWVLPLVLLPIVTSIATLVVGDFIFNGSFSAHVVRRTDSMLSFNKLLLLAIQIIIGAFTEEIAWRGFFLGKSMRIFSFWPCALASSVLFAVGHIAVGNFGIVLYDVVTIFIDSMIYALIYKKSTNCVISTVAHILCNATGVTAVLIFI